MDSNETTFFGLETMKKLYESVIKRNEDAVVIIIHWLLSKHGFRCIGVGDGREIAGDEIQSELLPQNWNNDVPYLMRYMFSKRLYLLRVTKTTDDVMLNLIKADDMKISCFLIKGSDINEDGLKGDIIYIEKIYKELISPFFEKPTSASKNRDRDSEAIHGRSLFIELVKDKPLPDFREVGRQDLDPFGAGAGAGMLLGRPHASRPSYRFDPINPEQGPLGPRGRFPFGANPDNDEFMPPGAYFM